MFKRSLVLVFLAAASSLLSGARASAQGGPTASISGTVVDSAGGAIPGASVVVKNDAGVAVEELREDVELDVEGVAGSGVDRVRSGRSPRDLASDCRLARAHEADERDVPA